MTSLVEQNKQYNQKIKRLQERLQRCKCQSHDKSADEIAKYKNVDLQYKSKIFSQIENFVRVTQSVIGQMKNSEIDKPKSTAGCRVTKTNSTLNIK